MNDYQFKLVKIMGDFVWHDHQDTDEVFIVLEGEMFYCLQKKAQAALSLSALGPSVPASTP